MHHSWGKKEGTKLSGSTVLGDSEMFWIFKAVKEKEYGNYKLRFQRKNPPPHPLKYIQHLILPSASPFNLTFNSLRSLNMRKALTRIALMDSGWPWELPVLNKPRPEIILIAPVTFSFVCTDRFTEIKHSLCGKKHLLNLSLFLTWMHNVLSIVYKIFL